MKARNLRAPRIPSFQNVLLVFAFVVALLAQPTAALSLVARPTLKTAMTPRTSSKVLASRGTPLSMWTMPAPPTLDFNAASSGTLWYSSIDPKARLPVYDEDVFSGEYSLSSPVDDWPSATDIMEASGNAPPRQEQQVTPRRPIRAIRRAAGKALGVIPRLVHLSF